MAAEGEVHIARALNERSGAGRMDAARPLSRTPNRPPEEGKEGESRSYHQKGGFTWPPSPVTSRLRSR
jgi:hypothetical protein